MKKKKDIKIEKTVKVKQRDLSIPEKVEKTNVADYCTGLMTIFGANVNIARHIPLMADSLLPVERRILYTMYLDDAKKPTALATIIGATMNRFHPHGDLSLHSTITRMAQPWKNILPLVTGEGNFGSIAGDKSGAARYIKAKLSKYALMCFFEDFDKAQVDMQPSYSREYDEPEFLPCRYPNLLINATPGMGYGIATSIPMHNFREACELTIALIKNSFHEPCILIPESPTGCNIIDNGQFKESCDTGKGKFIMRGEIEIDEEQSMIRIRSVPFQVNEGDVKINIIKLQDEKKINGIIRIQDDTTEGTVDLKLFLKKEVDLYGTVNVIYKKTLMERTYGIQLKLIHDNQDHNYNLRQLILEWIDIRRGQKRRYYNQKLAKCKNRDHILEILVFILNKDNAERTLAIIKKAANRKDVIYRLNKTYGISSLQCEIIADLQMSAFSKDSRKRYKDERDRLVDKIKEYEDILRSASEIDRIIIEELEEGIEMFGTPRMSKIIVIDDDEKYIRNTEHILVFTEKGYVKKLPAESTNIGSLASGDKPVEILTINNRKDALVFDSSGKITKITVNGLQNHEYDSIGERLSKFGNIQGDIVSVLIKPDPKEVEEDLYYLFLTKKGILKKTGADKYTNVRSEIMGSVIKEGDGLMAVRAVLGARDLVIYTKNGIALRFSSSDVKETGRMSIGLSACNLDKDDHIIGMDIISDQDKYIMILTNKGCGKKCPLTNFKCNNRNDPLLRIITLGEGEEICLAKTITGNELFKVYTKNTVDTIQALDIPELPRMSRSKKIIPLLKGNSVVDIKELKGS